VEGVGRRKGRSLPGKVEEDSEAKGYGGLGVLDLGILQSGFAFKMDLVPVDGPGSALDRDGCAQ
jgi:hypothetical protein